MYLIGTNLVKLKMSLAVTVMLGALCWSWPARAFDRSLTEEEVAKLEKNAKDDPSNSMSRRFLIDHYTKAGDWKKVTEFARPAQKDWPASTLIQAMNAYLEVGDGVSAATLASQYHAKFPLTSESKTIEGKALAMVARAETKDPVRKQKAQLAIDVLKDTAKMTPKDPTAYLAWVGVLREFWPNVPEDALHVYKILEGATGNYESYLSEKCELYVKASWWDQALTSCQRAVKKRPDHVESFIFLAQAQRVKVDIEVAKQTLEDILVEFPESGPGHLALATLLMEQSNFAGATDHYRKAIANKVADASVFLGLAQAEYQQKKYEEALEAYKSNCKLNRSVASEFRNATGQLRTPATYPLHIKYKNVMSSCR